MPCTLSLRRRAVAEVGPVVGTMEAEWLGEFPYGRRWLAHPRRFFCNWGHIPQAPCQRGLPSGSPLTRDSRRKGGRASPAPVAFGRWAGAEFVPVVGTMGAERSREFPHARRRVGPPTRRQSRSSSPARPRPGVFSSGSCAPIPPRGRPHRATPGFRPSPERRRGSQGRRPFDKLRVSGPRTRRDAAALPLQPAPPPHPPLRPFDKLRVSGRLTRRYNCRPLPQKRRQGKPCTLSLRRWAVAEVGGRGTFVAIRPRGG